MTLLADLKAWDGKSVDPVAAVYQACKDREAFPDELIAALSDTEYQAAASWLLKAWLQDERKIETHQAGAVLACLNDLQQWQAKLHILQCLPFMEIGSDHKTAVEYFLRQTLADSNKFVRAWSYNGFYILACQFPEYRDEVREFFRLAMQDESASVKARIRNVQKQGFLQS